MLARSQRKAGQGLSNFSRWQQIKRAVAALAVPRQGELARLELPTGWGSCLALPLALLPAAWPLSVQDAECPRQWCRGSRLDSCLQLSQGSESGEGKEGEKQLGQCLLVVPKGTHCVTWGPCAAMAGMELESCRDSRGKQCIAHQGS